MSEHDPIPSLELLGDRLEAAAARQMVARRSGATVGGAALSRRWLFVPALTGFVALAVVASVLLTDGSQSTDTASADVVSAMKKSAEVATGRFHIAADLQSANGTDRIDSDGAYDTRAGKVRQTVDASALLHRLGPGGARVPAGGLKAELIVDRGTLYGSLPGVPWLARTAAGEQRWFRLGSQPTEGPNTPVAPTPSDPSGLFDLFGGVDKMVRLDDDRIDGAVLAHYRGEIDLDRAYRDLAEADRKRLDESLGGIGGGLPRTGRVPVEVWVDSNRIVRRLASTIDLSSARAGTSARFVIDFSDLGEAVDIPVPDPSAVSELPGLGELMSGASATTPKTR